jgi:hypothetical protein
MKRGARVFGLAVATLGAVACLLSLALAQPVANEVVQWNETTMKFIEANGQAPPCRRAPSRWCTGQSTTR